MSSDLSRLNQGNNQLFISRGAIFMKFHSMTSSCSFNRGTTFSQTVTCNNNVILPADTKSIVYKHTHSAQRLTTLKMTKPNVLQQRWRLNHRCQAKFLTCKISDLTPYAHAPSNIQQIKYAEKTDD